MASLFGLAPDGVCRAVRITASAVSSYLAISPLPGLPEEHPSRDCSSKEDFAALRRRSPPGGHRRYLSVALSVALGRRLRDDL